MGLLKPQSGGSKLKSCIIQGSIEKPIYTDGIEFIWGYIPAGVTKKEQLVMKIGSLAKPTTFNPHYLSSAILSDKMEDLYKIVDIKLYGSNMHSLTRNSIGAGSNRLIQRITLEEGDYYFITPIFTFIPDAINKNMQYQSIEIFYQD